MEQSYVDRIYKEIGELRIELEPDPTVLGARYIQGVTSKCRNYLNRVTQIRIQLSQKKRNLMMQVAGAETSLSIERSRLLAEDDTVKRGSNIADREAIANTMLRRQINEIASMKMDLLDIETVDKAVKMSHDELIRTSQEIKVQRSLLFSDRTSGAGYGDETPINGSTPPPPATGDINENELENLMKGSVPLVKESAPDEEDPDLLAALASIEDEEPAPEVKPDVVADPVDNSSTKAEISDRVPQGEKSVEVASSVSDDDFTEFLEDKPAPSKASAKKPKSSEDAPPKVKLDDIDMDFGDILNNV